MTALTTVVADTASYFEGGGSSPLHLKWRRLWQAFAVSVDQQVAAGAEKAAWQRRLAAREQRPNPAGADSAVGFGAVELAWRFDPEVSCFARRLLTIQLSRQLGWRVSG